MAKGGVLPLPPGQDPEKSISNQTALGGARLNADERKARLAAIIADLQRRYTFRSLDGLAKCVSQCDPSLILMGETWDNFVKEVANNCEKGAAMSVTHTSNQTNPLI